MKSSITHRPVSFIARAATVVALAVAVMPLAGGCDGGREGERCNPSLSHNECHNGLTCRQPSTCAESYCCPADPTRSTNPYCNGAGCPAVDAGTVDASTDDGSTTDVASEAAADAGGSG